MKSGKMIYNGGEIYYEISGPSDGETIVLVHGFAMDTRMWEPQVTFFEKQYQVIVYDLRDYGKSSDPTGPYSDPDDLRALLKYLRVSKIHLAGFSRGGRVAIDFVLKYPKLVRSLATIDAALGGFDAPIGLWDYYAKELGLQQCKENWYNHEVFAGTRYNPEVMARVREMLDDFSGWFWMNEHYPPDPASAAAHSRLPEIAVPTLVIVGQNDLPYFRDVAAEIGKRVKGAQQVVLPGVGHASSMEAPDKVNRLLLKHVETA